MSNQTYPDDWYPPDPAEVVTEDRNWIVTVDSPAEVKAYEEGWNRAYDYVVGIYSNYQAKTADVYRRIDRSQTAAIKRQNEMIQDLMKIIYQLSDQIRAYGGLPGQDR